MNILLLGLAEKSGLLVLGGDYSGVSKDPDKADNIDKDELGCRVRS